MFATLKLPFRFDPTQLKADLGKIMREEWKLHHNRHDYEGGWRGAALRSQNGSASNLVLAPDGRSFLDTPLLGRCEYFRKVLAEFPCRLKGVRLLSLAPDSFIREHTDRELRYEDGEVRIHIPIQTSPGVEFYVLGERLILEEGCAYYLNAHLPHRVNNRGSVERVHLVIDAEVNEWVHELFRRASVEDWRVASAGPDKKTGELLKIILDDAGLQNQLLPVSTRQEFIDKVCRLGTDCGFDLTPGDIDAALNVVQRKELPRPIHLVQRENAAESLRGWIPARLHFKESKPIVEWAYLGDRLFGDRLLQFPLFESAMQDGNFFATVLRRYSPIELLEELEPCESGIAPAGLIFHTSQCGSTLLCQMLAAASNLVISKAEPIDQVVHADLHTPELPAEEQVRWLRWMVNALGRHRAGGEARYFLKLPMWHIHRLPLFCTAFPETPWTFLFRDPVEVAAANLNSPSLSLVPGMLDCRMLAMNPDEIATLNQAEWCCQIIARICRSALRYGHEPKGLFVDYKMLPDAAWGSIAQHFGLSLSEDEIERMLERSKYNAKNMMYWTGEKENSRQFKNQDHRDYAHALLDPLYHELRTCCRRNS